MIDLAPEIRAALESNPDLITLLGGTRVYRVRAPDPTEFPRITFFEMTNFDSDFADDKAIASEVHFQIDIWTKASFSEIVIQVDKTMKEIGWARTATGPDLFETEGAIFHKPLRYSTKRKL